MIRAEIDDNDKNIVVTEAIGKKSGLTLEMIALVAHLCMLIGDETSIGAESVLYALNVSVADRIMTEHKGIEIDRRRLGMHLLMEDK